MCLPTGVFTPFFILFILKINKLTIKKSVYLGPIFKKTPKKEGKTPLKQLKMSNLYLVFHNKKGTFFCNSLTLQLFPSSSFFLGPRFVGIASKTPLRIMQNLFL